MKRILNEPLLHFLLIGALIFGAYSLLNRGSSSEPGKIVVTQGQQATMFETFSRTRQRAPTQAEWQGLIRDRVQEEVYYREALALGLDKDDLIIRRRLRQKLEFVSEGLTAPTQASEAQLQAYLSAHSAAFATEAQFSFRHVYLDPQRHGANLARDVERLLAGLNDGGARADPTGDPIALEREFERVSARDVTSLFGEKFATALDKLQPGRWQGPVESGYGVHLVFLAQRSAGGTAALADVREAVRREWNNDQQREAADRFYQGLLKKYAVVIEPAPSAAASPADAAAAR